LRNPIIAGIQKSPLRFITEATQLLGDPLAISKKGGIQQTTDIFQHDGTRAALKSQSENLGKKITLICLA